MRRLSLPLGFAFLAVFSVAEPPARPVTAAQVNRQMATGFNLGNTFDLGLHSTAPADVKPLIDLYVAAGMRHVRIPVTWGEPIKGSLLADRTGKLNPNNPRFRQLGTVVDYALSKGLYVIVNAHHEHWLKDHYDGSPTYDRAFADLWTGIAQQFKNRSQKLVFEILNEPEKAFGDWSGPVKPFDPQALSYTRKVNEIGWRAVRQAGGANRTRIVMVGTNGQGNQSMLDELYPTAAILPGGGKDPYLMVTVHTYDPWPFCGQDGSNAKWPGEAAIAKPIRDVAAHARMLGVPVNYGEFGVGREKDQSERDTDLVRGYYRTVRRTAQAEGMSVTPWDDRGWFGLTTRSNDGKYRFLHRIVPSMMKPQ
ncbi:glycoside hydrolase family 5 protein [bacterium]|nr:MAG: glycoside hydrolase family 5 protein [bacterium]